MSAKRHTPARKGRAHKPKPAPQPGQPRRTALITGITGQDGSYLAELLLAKGYDVVGVVRRTSHDSYERIGHLLDRVHIVPADLLDQHSLTTVVRDAKPDEIYNRSEEHTSELQSRRDLVCRLLLEKKKKKKKKE